MRAPDFWWREPGIASTLLSPLGFIYGAVAAARMRRTGTRANVPVICVGNPTVGGAGKTPAALALAAILKDLGEQPFFLTRGYGGRIQGPVVVDPRKHDAREAGDEPLLLAKTAPTIVAADRVAGVEHASRSGASVIVMDDGFQNPSLEKDFSLLVIDGGRMLGNERLFPAGPLRAPLDAQYRRAQGIILIGGENSGRSFPDGGLPVLAARLQPDASARDLAGKRVLAFAGIGNPEKFFASLRAIGAEVVEMKAFGDHHYYSAADARALLDTAGMNSLQLVTTEKDLARMQGNRALAELAATARVLPVKLGFGDPDGVQTMLKAALGRARETLSP